MAGGITAQYGFLYQKCVYILMILKNIAVDKYFVYEGVDDIDVYKEDSLFSLSVSNKSYIQVKSGIVDENCMIRVIGNWMNMDGYSNELEHYLCVENDIQFNYKSDEYINKILEAFQSGESMRKDSILRKAYDKYSSELLKPNFKEKISGLLNSMKLEVMSLDNIQIDMLSQFSKDYCSDIIEFELAKKKRLERFKDYIVREIDNSISKKQKFVLTYSRFISLIQRVNDEIADNRYVVDVYTTKKKMEPQARKIVSDRKEREVQQLSLVDGDETFILDGILQEMLYKDFREVYSTVRKIDISNIETEAKENHDEAKRELSDLKKVPHEVYFSTVKKNIDNSLLPSGYRKGCYIFLTKSNTPADFLITWGSCDTNGNSEDDNSGS